NHTPGQANGRHHLAFRVRPQGHVETGSAWRGAPQRPPGPCAPVAGRGASGPVHRRRAVLLVRPDRLGSTRLPAGRRDGGAGRRAGDPTSTVVVQLAFGVAHAVRPDRLRAFALAVVVRGAGVGTL